VGGVVCGDTNNVEFIYVHYHCRFRCPHRQPSGTGRQLPAWTYVYNRSIKKLLCIASGDYLLYLANKNDFKPHRFLKPMRFVTQPPSCNETFTCRVGKT